MMIPMPILMPILMLMLKLPSQRQLTLMTHLRICPVVEDVVIVAVPALVLVVIRGEVPSVENLLCLAEKNAVVVLVAVVPREVETY
jgi:hypothetical protein